jgi:ribosomal protein S19E (S16A)
MKQEKREAVEKYLNGEIGFKDLRERIGEENSKTVQESERILEEGEEIAEQLMENIESDCTLTEEEAEEISRKIDRDAADRLPEESGE